MNFLLFLWVIESVRGYNFDYYQELSVETLIPPKALQNDSYFGYSVTYDQYNRRMIISAPRASNIGEVYQCYLSTINDKSCSLLPADIEREAPLYKHDYWFGATLEAGPDFVMACAPRFSRNITGCDNVGVFGRCYIRKEAETSFGSYLAPVPITPKKEIYKGKEICVHTEKTMDTLGFSLDIGEDNSVIVGGPVLFNTGIAAVKPSNKNFFKRMDKIEQRIYNFGYSVAIGNFTSAETISYAVSTTYGTFGQGKVYFYTYESGKLDKYITLQKGVDLDVIGSMFGAVLCTVNINEVEKGHDLLVGAPSYTLHTSYNTGAVYVYGYKEGLVGPEFRKKIMGYKSGSLFGSSITSVGDLNGDGKDEIAIGAPFEDDGVVYLYSGASIYSTDKTSKLLQKIKASTKIGESFGFSLTALYDYDNNGCKELAIGVPFMNKVMLYKCFSAVTITNLYAVFPDVKNRSISRQTDYIFQVCMDIQYPKKPERIIDEITTDVTMDHDYATLKRPNNNKNVYTFKTSLQSKNKTFCKDVEFVLPLDKDYSMQVLYTLTTKLSNSFVNVKKSSDTHVLLSDNSVIFHSGVFSANECSTRECLSDLTLNITTDLICLHTACAVCWLRTHSNRVPHMIGSQDRGTFHMTVLNNGEVAYDPCIEFSVSGGSLLTLPMYCTYLEDKCLCTTMKPLRTSSPWDIKNIIVDLRDLTSENKNITLNIKLFDRCSEKNHSKPYEFSVPLNSYYDGVIVKGTTDVGDVVNIAKEEVSFPKHFKQTFTITNIGPTNFKDVTCWITMNKTDFIIYSEAPVSIYMESTSVMSHGSKIDNECEVVTNNLEELTAKCPLPSLYKDNYAKLIVSLETDPDVLTYKVLKKRAQFAVNTTLHIQFDESILRSFNMSTFVRLQVGVVDLWILLAAGLVGLLLIIVLTIVLYKSGFLQRKNKKKLENLKKDVRRQTIRRSMMAQAEAEAKHKSNRNSEETTPLRVSR